MRIFLLVLPWLWIAAGVWVLLVVPRRVRRPRAAKAFALVLVLTGASEFFVTPSGNPAWWLAAWQGACAAAAVGIVAYLALRARN